MKKVITIFLIVFVFKSPYAQYTVTKVIGTVKNNSSGEILKTGSKFNDGDALVWSSPKDMVRTIVAGQGIYIMTPSPKAQSQGSSLLEIVKFTLHIKSNNDNLSGRSGSMEMIPEALETETKINSKILIEEQNKFVFDKNIYDVSNGNKFFLQTEVPGSKPVIHSLKTRGDTLILYQSDFKNPGIKNSDGVQYKLGFFSKDNSVSKIVAAIDPYFDTDNEMKKIIKLIVKESKQTDKIQLQQDCYYEIYRALGKPSDIDFENVYNKMR